MRHLLIHAGIFFTAQVVFATVFGYSWPWEAINQRVPITSIIGSAPEDHVVVGNISRIWTIVLIIDIAWTLLTPTKRKTD